MESKKGFFRGSCISPFESSGCVFEGFTAWDSPGWRGGMGASEMGSGLWHLRSFQTRWGSGSVFVAHRIHATGIFTY